MRTQLNETQAERAQLRAYYQLDDTRDVRDVVESFQKFNVLVRNSCLFASSAVLQSVQSQGWRAASSSWTTKDAISPRQLQKVLDGAAALISSSSPSFEERSAGRKLDEFLPEAFRFVVNAALVHQLFAVFHPDLSDNDNALLMNVYRDIRSRGQFIEVFSQPRSHRLFIRPSTPLGSMALFDLLFTRLDHVFLRIVT